MRENQYRSLNGKFGVKKKDNNKKKALDAMIKAKKKCLRSDSGMNILSGNRLINLKKFTESIMCKNCNELLDLKICSEEKRVGSFSSFKVNCDKCNLRNSVNTSKMHENNSHQYPDINMSAVLGKYYQSYCVINVIFYTI